MMPITVTQSSDGLFLGRPRTGGPFTALACPLKGPRLKVRDHADVRL